MNLPCNLPLSPLHIEYHDGEGEPLLFIHGWGMHSGMWGGVLAQLARQYRVMAVDLPGHGWSAKKGLLEVVSGKSAEPHMNLTPLTTDYLDSIVEQLAARFNYPLTVCGWSLGGQIALRWAQRYPQQVVRLILLSSTPCFVQKPDWLCAMETGTLLAFSDALRQDQTVTLRRFVALQVRGSEQERELLTVMRRALFDRGEPDSVALQQGLAILRDVDLRSALSEISAAVLVIAGECDTLTPIAASAYLAENLLHARLVTIPRAAHVCFLSHPNVFVKHLVDFLHE
jgi:pimeloyl-[acyl-carrier protein] methyl ester esterase